MLFFKKVYQFYRHDCCWPYAASFFLVMVIYWLDFFTVKTHYRWVSLLAYAIIFAYYLYNLYYYSQGKIKARDNKFFMRYLSSKVILWGFILLLLYTFAATKPCPWRARMKNGRLSMNLKETLASKAGVAEIHPPSQETTPMGVEECEKEAASGDVTGWASLKHVGG